MKIFCTGMAPDNYHNWLLCCTRTFCWWYYFIHVMACTILKIKINVKHFVYDTLWKIGNVIRFFDVHTVYTRIYQVFHCTRVYSSHGRMQRKENTLLFFRRWCFIDKKLNASVSGHFPPHYERWNLSFFH